MTMTTERKKGLGIGAVFLSFFGALWLTVGTELLYGKNAPINPAIWAVGGLICLAALRLIWTNRRPVAGALVGADRNGNGKWFIVINVIQYATLFLMQQVLGSYGYGDWLIPGAMLVVGLHFFPLAKLFNYRAHLVTGTGLVAVALLYPFVGKGPLDPVGCFCAGLILWGAAVFGLSGATFYGVRLEK